MMIDSSPRCSPALCDDSGQLYIQGKYRLYSYARSVPSIKRGAR